MNYNPACLSFFRPVTLAFETHLGLHLTEVLLLLISETIRIKIPQGCIVETNGEEPQET